MTPSLSVRPEPTTFTLRDELEVTPVQRYIIR